VNVEKGCEPCFYVFFLCVMMEALGKLTLLSSLLLALAISLKDTSSLNSFSQPIACFLYLLLVLCSSPDLAFP